MSQEKEYTGTLVLGATTASYDLETMPENHRDYSRTKSVDLERVRAQFMGEIIQIPPVYSAIKKEGKRSYDLAREGKAVVLDGRKITIREFEMTIEELPVVSFRVVCSTGTYIRSLVNDVGAMLGCGAYLKSLCRTRIGNFKLADAIEPDAPEIRIRKDN
jgi:tRNA pseudouridine55 synthase